MLERLLDLQLLVIHKYLILWELCVLYCLKFLVVTLGLLFGRLFGSLLGFFGVVGIMFVLIVIDLLVHFSNEVIAFILLDDVGAAFRGLEYVVVVICGIASLDVPACRALEEFALLESLLQGPDDFTLEDDPMTEVVLGEAIHYFVDFGGIGEMDQLDVSSCLKQGVLVLCHLGVERGQQGVLQSGEQGANVGLILQVERSVLAHKLYQADFDPDKLIKR